MLESVNFDVFHIAAICLPNALVNVEFGSAVDAEVK